VASNILRIAVCLALGLGAGCTKKAAPEAAERKASETEPEHPPKSPPPDAERSPSGLASKVLRPGTGDERPRPYDKVRVHFTGWNEKGKRIGSSTPPGEAVTFDLTGVIAGWSEALQQMRVGEQRRIWVPDELGYPGRPGFPRGMSVFDIELLEIIHGVAPLPAPADVAAAPADATRTRGGLAYRLLARGQGGDKPNPWDAVTIHYTGWTEQGVMFESSRGQQRPSSFELAKVMPGWREALVLLAVGDSARVWIPEALAYQGQAGKPKGSVVFDIELLSIERRPEPPRPPADVAAVPRDARRTASGLAYRMLAAGKGNARPKPHDRVELHYSAFTTDGTLFDSSVVRGKPVTVPVSRLIPGWAEGVQLMKVGGKALLWIPEKLAYEGRPGSPRGMLVYEVELLSIVPPAPP
jgi:FKBP-type peptidyl-prolyl cis-trans isomerase